MQTPLNSIQFSGAIGGGYLAVEQQGATHTAPAQLQDSARPAAVRYVVPMNVQSKRRLTLYDEELLVFLHQFLHVLKQRSTPAAAILLAARDAWRHLDAVPNGVPTVDVAAAGGERRGAAGCPADAPRIVAEPPEFLLRISHKCVAVACSDSQCALCKYNPVKKCTRQLRKQPYTYTTDDNIVSTCGAPLIFQVCDLNGKVLKEVPQQLQGLSIMICAVDERRYREVAGGKGDEDSAAATSRTQCSAPLSADRFAIFNTPDGTPLTRLHEGRGLVTADFSTTIRSLGEGSYDGAVAVPLAGPETTVNGLKVRMSCEALLAGKRPNIRFLARIVDPARYYNPVTRVAGVLSEAFLVTTNRAKGRGEGTALLCSDRVLMLPGVGVETQRKLLNFKDWSSKLTDADPHACDLKIDELPPSINTVEDFGKLLSAVDHSASMRRVLRDILKLPDDQRWQDLENAVRTSVLVDNRMRVYRASKSLTILFGCINGRVDLMWPLGILSPRSEAGKVTMIPIVKLSSKQRERMTSLAQFATKEWYLEGHKNWTLTPYCSIAGSKGVLQFVTDGNLRAHAEAEFAEAFGETLPSLTNDPPPVLVASATHALDTSAAHSATTESEGSPAKKRARNHNNHSSDATAFNAADGGNGGAGQGAGAGTGRFDPVAAQDGARGSDARPPSPQKQPQYQPPQRDSMRMLAEVALRDHLESASARHSGSGGGQDSEGVLRPGSAEQRYSGGGIPGRRGSLNSGGGGGGSSRSSGAKPPFTISPSHLPHSDDDPPPLPLALTDNHGGASSSGGGGADPLSADAATRGGSGGGGSGDGGAWPSDVDMYHSGERLDFDETMRTLNSARVLPETRPSSGAGAPAQPSSSGSRMPPPPRPARFL